MTLSIVTAEKTLFEGEITEFSSETAQGHFEILSDHQPLIYMTVPTFTTIKGVDGDHTFLTGQGLLHLENNKLSFIVEEGYSPQDLKREQVEEELILAQKLLQEDPTSSLRKEALRFARLKESFLSKD